MLTRQPPPTFSEPPIEVSVEVASLRAVDYPVWLETQGQVQARTQSALVPEVSGSVVEVGANFREGGFFAKGDLLLRLDDRDYQAALSNAQSAHKAALTMLEEEKARSRQAIEDWKRLGRTGEPGPLVSRTLHVAESQAKADAAKNQAEKAQRDLQRTTILAPYDGRVMEKTADVGQYVAAGREVGKIFAVDYAEIRLPLHNQQLEFVELPEAYRGEQAGDRPGPKVALRANVAGKESAWEGRIVRSSGIVAADSLQIYATAQVDDPYGRKAPGTPPLKVGQWVQARIEGRMLKNVFLIPRSAIREGTEVLTVNAESRLVRRQIQPIYSDGAHVIVSAAGELKPNEQLCLTSLAFAVDNAKVKIVGNQVESSAAVTQKQASARPSVN